MALALLLLCVLLAVAAYWALLFVGQRSLLFPAPAVAGAPPRPADAEPVWLETPAGRVESWWLPPAVSSAGPCPALIFTHGNGELIDYWPDAFDEPRRWGLGVLLVEYPGYGRSAGRPSDSAIRDTVLAAADWARRQPQIDASRLVPYGRSLGGSAAAMLAVERPVPVLILESAFTNARAFARQFGAPGFLVRDPLDTLAAVRRFDGPVLVLHGDRDEIVPTDHGRALAAASPRATLQLLPCGHNDCARPWPQVRTFLQSHHLLPPITR
jgi:fermentation-respiration switch protein FrsA (DUF1100 family)